jgi:Mlc titration factor MtfA (ptsG expression regulator)
VVIHEFAHQLDFLDGSVNGTPELLNSKDAERWHDVMTTEFNRLRYEVDTGHDTFLGDYAATNETEFFSVASERFFTVPQHMVRLHPHLYEVLADFYGVTPVVWFHRLANG